MVVTEMPDAKAASILAFVATGVAGLHREDLPGVRVGRAIGDLHGESPMLLQPGRNFPRDPDVIVGEYKPMGAS
jgi:hypothetical protein